jgi:pimeloyl-ACP methyl ester carboxylesterase
MFRSRWGRVCTGTAVLVTPVAAAHQLGPWAPRHAGANSSGGSGGGVRVPLASSVASPVRPTTVLVHGLDSCRETWNGVLADLAKAGYPAVALDLRGHGESPLGPPEDFSADSLARDVLEAVATHGVHRPVVLVGHSMGGRIAMRCAALDVQRVAAGAPPLLSACIIEDMDTVVRAPPTPPHAELSEAQRTELHAFEQPSGRVFGSWEQAAAALAPWYGDDARRVRGWRGGRVRPLPAPERGWWSDINPAAQRLARQQVLASTDGAEAWAALGQAAAPPGPGLHLRLGLWVADSPGTVCSWDAEGGIHAMERQVHGCKALLFEGSTHSIHNSCRKQFVAELKAVVDKVAEPCY